MRLERSNSRQPTMPQTTHIQQHDWQETGVYYVDGLKTGEHIRATTEAKNTTRINRMGKKRNGIGEPRTCEVRCIIDSGASSTATGNSRMMHNLQPNNGNLIVANGNTAAIEANGDIILTSEAVSLKLNSSIDEATERKLTRKKASMKFPALNSSHLDDDIILSAIASTGLGAKVVLQGEVDTIDDEEITPNFLGKVTSSKTIGSGSYI